MEEVLSGGPSCAGSRGGRIRVEDPGGRRSAGRRGGGSQEEEEEVLWGAPSLREEET